MADVVTRCVAAEDVHNGSVVVAVGIYKFDEDITRVKDETATESITVQEDRLENRFDDTSYYST